MFISLALVTTYERGTVTVSFSPEEDETQSLKNLNVLVIPAENGRSETETLIV